jgi:hypothetical protein
MPGRAPERRLSRGKLERLIQLIEPRWTLDTATFMEEGISTIYAVTISTDSGPRQCYLKATPLPDDPAGIGTEARLTEVVRQRTEIPVPPVIGAVDTHDRVRAPFFLMDAIAGTRVM